MLAHYTALQELDVSRVRRDVFVSSISVSDRHRDLVKGLPASLISLCVDTGLTPSNFTAITDSCKKLRHLQSKCRAGKELRDLQGQWPSTGLTQGLRALGAQLESLSVSEISSEECLGRIRTHCPNVYSLELAMSCRTLNDKLVDFLTSYSTQLKTMWLSKMTLAQCKSISRGCPAADCMVECDVGGLKYAVLGLGDRLVHLHVCTGEERANPNAIRDVAVFCVRFRKVEWRKRSYGDVRVLRALLSAGCQGARSLRVRAPDREHMDAVSSGVSTLREFRYHWSTHSPGLFDAFAQSNTHLEIVDVGVKHMQMDEEAVCVDIVKSFAVCKSLRELYADIEDRPMTAKRPAIMDALNVYRRNSSYVTLCQVKYLPL